MVKVFVRHSSSSEPRTFTPSNAANLHALVACSRHFGPGGSLEDEEEVVVGDAYVLKEDMVLTWYTAPGRMLPQTHQQRVELLVENYGDALRRRMTRVGNLAQRAGPIAKGSSPPSSLIAAAQPSTSATGPVQTVKPIGQYFQLRGLRGPAVQLFQLLLSMDERFLDLKRMPKPEQGTQLLRLVGAPGVGKSTALVQLWTELHAFVLEHLDELLRQLPDSWHSSRLVERVRSSLNPERTLVFVMDLSKQDLGALARQEQGATSQCVLALRMLYSALHGPLSPAPSYNDFLGQLGALIPPTSLEPLDILQFVKSASGLRAEEHSLVVFAVDEANLVLCPVPGQPSWLQLLFSSFVDLRCRSAPLHMMPLLITASTMASAATLHTTSSGQSKVADVQLLPQTAEDMEAITLDICSRLGQPSSGLGSSGAIGKHIAKVFRFLGGNPRHLAWALACMSGSPNSPSEETLLLGRTQACPWLSDASSFKLVTVLDKLASTLEGWKSWLTSSGKGPAFNQIVAHAVLGRGVRRADVIPHMEKITWQEAENAGVCLLVRTGCTISGSPASSRNNSSGGRGEGCMGSEADVAADAPCSSSSTVSAVLSSARQQEDAASSSVPGCEPDHFVCLPPVLAVMALRNMSVEGRNVLDLPLCQCTDDWRSREFTDIHMLLLKLQLLASVLKEEKVPLGELLPGKLPEEFSQMSISVPCSCGEGGMKFPTVQGQLAAKQFEDLCDGASYEKQFAFVGPSNFGPDSWLVLQVADAVGGSAGSRLVLFLQSKKRTDSKKETLKRTDLDKEAAKCWDCPPNMQQLMLYVTDQQTSKVHSPHQAAGKGGRAMSVVVIGPEEHARFYTPGLGFIKRSMEYQALSKRPKHG